MAARHVNRFDRRRHHRRLETAPPMPAPLLRSYRAGPPSTAVAGARRPMLFPDSPAAAPGLDERGVNRPAAALLLRGGSLACGSAPRVLDAGEDCAKARCAALFGARGCAAPNRCGAADSGGAAGFGGVADFGGAAGFGGVADFGGAAGFGGVADFGGAAGFGGMARCCAAARLWGDTPCRAVSASPGAALTVSAPNATAMTARATGARIRNPATRSGVRRCSPRNCAKTPAAKPAPPPAA